MNRYVLGISCFYHDSAVSLLKNGEIIFACEEEKFTRKKHDKSFPRNGIKHILKMQNISLEDIETIIFYDKPLLKFDRLIESYIATAPFSFSSFRYAIPQWVNEKLFTDSTLKKELHLIDERFDTTREIQYSRHHYSHAASAFFPSGFESAGILCVDGVGEWETTTIFRGNGNKIEPIKHINFPHSLGLFYSAFTYYLGFQVNNGEYKMMGLSSYGNPIYVDLILSNLIKLHDDGSYALNMDYFDFVGNLKMITKKFEKLFSLKTRREDETIAQIHMDIAASCQKVFETAYLNLAKHVKEVTGESKICLAGGCALNCVANSVILNSNIFEDIWIQPAANDAGASLGAALVAWYSTNERVINNKDSMKGSYLGPEYTNEEIEETLKKYNFSYERASYTSEQVDILAREIVGEKVIGIFQGKSEFGPRALGHRSIIADARSKNMQSILNLKTKFRESFRPFAPIVLESDMKNYFNVSDPSPYMLFTSSVKNIIKQDIKDINLIRSDIPAVTHVDYSARLQTIDTQRNTNIYSLLDAFKTTTGCSVIINTSFNIKGEPIVLSPFDALRCFMKTQMDVLSIGDFLLYKDKQKTNEIEDYTTFEISGELKESPLRKIKDYLLSDYKDMKTDLPKSFINLLLTLAVIFYIIFPFILKKPSYINHSVVIGILVLLRLINIKLLKPIFLVYSMFIRAMHFIKSNLLLILGYYLCISPVGLMYKLLGKDPLMRKNFRSTEATFYEESTYKLDLHKSF